MSTPLIVFPDVPMMVLGYLRPALAARTEAYAQDVELGSGVALSPRADRMVMVRDDSGPRLDVARQQPSIGINVWGRNEQETRDLARLVAALVWAAPDGNPLIRADGPVGPYEVEDESGQDRQYMTFDLIIRATETL